MDDEKNDFERKEALRAGVWVIVMLLVITFGEFIMALIATGWGNLLILVALSKAYFVLKDYMHIGRLFSKDEEVH
ncbi:MAG: hypothetical protein FVQ83_06570 [Chloroflexi bacterium]|nr:hypothetical protein [Chloroflexota bacterium]